MENSIRWIEFDRQVLLKTIFSGQYFLDSLTHEGSHALFTDTIKGFGVVNENELVGYILYNIDGFQSNIPSMSVAPSHRRCGWGRSLIGKVIDICAKQGCQNCSVTVRIGNLAALLLYKEIGFVVTKRLFNHYCLPVEDGFELMLHLRQDCRA